MSLEPLPLPERKARKVKRSPPLPPTWPSIAVLLAGLISLGLGLVPAMAFRLGGLAPRDLQYAGLVLLATGGLLLVRRALLAPGSEAVVLPPTEGPWDLPAGRPIEAAAEPVLPAPQTGEDSVVPPPRPGRRVGLLEELLVSLSVFFAGILLIGVVVYLELQWYFADAPYRFAGFAALAALVLGTVVVRAMRSRRRMAKEREELDAADLGLPPAPPGRQGESIDFLSEISAAGLVPRRSRPPARVDDGSETPSAGCPDRSDRQSAVWAHEPPAPPPAGMSAGDSAAEPAAVPGPAPSVKQPVAPVPDKGARSAAAPVLLLRSGRMGVGLDIGTSHIKLVQVRGVRRGAVVTAFGSSTVPRMAVAEGAIVKPMEVAEAIRGLMRETGVRRRRVVTVVGGPGVILRQVQFPRMSERELRKVLRWEAERHIPIPPDEAIIDFSILDDMLPERSAKGQPGMQVMLAGTHRKMVQGLLDAMRAASLYPMAIDIDALASYRVLAANGYCLPHSGSRSVVMLDLGASSTKLSVFLNGIPQFNRTINVGGNDFTAAIAEGLGQDMTVAEVTKWEFGVLPDTAVSRFLQPSLDELLLEVRRSIEFYLARRYGEDTWQIYLTGGGAALKGLPHTLADYLTLSFGERGEESELTVAPVEPLRELEVHPKLGGQQSYFGPQFTIALGLALREGG